jgi:acyl-lipid omega-6 desaturase (Delta-12 desaturase)
LEPSPSPNRATCARDWAKILSGYGKPNPSRSVLEIGITGGGFVILWAAIWASWTYGFWPGLLLVVPAGGFLVRLFMIQHDCAHLAFFRHRIVNDWVGRVIGTVTLTPHDLWRRSHGTHHASSGHLDRRGIGDVRTLTVREYCALSYFGKLAYRLYRNPFVLFGLGPAYLFLLENRLPVAAWREGWEPWISTMVTNVAICGLMATMMTCLGVLPFLVVHVPIAMIGASIGVWLFYVQHQFETTHWERAPNWTFHEAALYGSSYYDLPLVLRWFTANIGAHHVHHLCSRIPFYRLPRVLRDHPELTRIGRLTLRQSLGCVRLSLWDETSRRLVSFKDLGRQSSNP